MTPRDQTTDLERAAAAEDGALVERVEREAVNAFGVLSDEEREAVDALNARLARYRDALALIASGRGTSLECRQTARDALAVVRPVTVDGWQFCVLRDGDDQYVAARPLEPDHALGREWQPTDNLRTAHWRPSHLRTIAELLDPIQRAVDAENAAYRRAKEAA